MIQYIKVRLYKKSDGSFAGNGVIIKVPSSAIPGTVFFSFISKNGVFPFADRGEAASSFQFNDEQGDMTIMSEQGALRAGMITTGSDVDSFETVLISERIRTDSIFLGYRVQPDTEIFQTNGVFSVNFDDLFIREAQEDHATGGVRIKAAYTQSEIYSGFSSYHHNQRVHRFNQPYNNDRPYRIGVELEVYAKSRADYEAIIGARTNWFQCESDSSLTQYQFPIEIKTIPLRPVDATSVDFWAEPMAELKRRAFSKQKKVADGQYQPVSSTGLHVHISKEIFGATETVRQRNLQKLIFFYTYFVEDDENAHRKNVIICGRESGYHTNPNGAKTELGDFAKLIGFNEVAKSDAAFSKMAGSVKSACDSQRGDINTQNWNGYGTVEFRKGKGAISKIRLAAICTWWEQMCLYCNETSPRDFSFDAFFNRVCRESPAVAYFFQQDDEG